MMIIQAQVLPTSTGDFLLLHDDPRPAGLACDISHWLYIIVYMFPFSQASRVKAPTKGKVRAAMASSRAGRTATKEEQETLLTKEVEKNQNCHCCRAKGCSMCFCFALVLLSLSVLVHLNWWFVPLDLAKLSWLAIRVLFRDTSDSVG